MRSSRLLVLAAAQLAVGAAAIFARYALGGAGALAVSAGRLTIAAAVLIGIDGIRRVVRPRYLGRASIPQRDARGASIPQRDKTSAFVLAGVALAVHFATWIWSLQYTSVAISTLLVATTPVWTALYDAVFLKRGLSAVAWLAMLAGGIGTVMIVWFSHTPPPVAGHQMLGAALAIFGAIAIGAYFIVVRGFREEYGTREIVTRTYSIAAVALVAASAVAHQGPPALNDAPAWGGIIAMALISQLLGHTAMNAALRWFSPSAVAMSTLVEPVIAAVLAYAIFSEALTGVAILGGMLVLCAIGVFLREERQITETAAA